MASLLVLEGLEMERVFTNLIRLSGQKEDFFTECLAMSLNEDAQLSGDFSRVILGDKAEDVLRGEPIIHVSTQCSYDDVQGCCIDMVIDIGGKRTIGVENKLYAAEGEDQLLRYLQLPMDHLAFITGSPGYNIAAPVMVNPKYFRPSNEREHFIWHDFFGCVDAAARRASSPLSPALRELFVQYGFTPPHPGIGDLNSLDSEENRRNRENMRKLWERTRTAFVSRGWRTETGSIAELYLKGGPDERLEDIWLNPADRQGALRMRITPGKGIRVEDLVRVVEAHREEIHPDLMLEPRQVRRQLGMVNVLDVLVSFDRLLGDDKDPEETGRRLASFTTSVHDLIIGDSGGIM